MSRKHYWGIYIGEIWVPPSRISQIWAPPSLIQRIGKIFILPTYLFKLSTCVLLIFYGTIHNYQHFAAVTLWRRRPNVGSADKTNANIFLAWNSKVYVGRGVNWQIGSLWRHDTIAIISHVLQLPQDLHSIMDMLLWIGGQVNDKTEDWRSN